MVRVRIKVMVSVRVKVMVRVRVKIMVRVRVKVMVRVRVEVRLRGRCQFYVPNVSHFSPEVVKGLRFYLLHRCRSLPSRHASGSPS